MKILYKFILKSYAGPFVLTFFIAMFVFFMMFIFKYIDDFVGKGLESSVLFELFFYFSLTTIPMALPLAILLSSLMTFGNLGEHVELSAMKSAGLSLQKIMSPLIITIFFISVAAFYFSNSILPYTNLKAGSLLYDIRSSKPALMFKDGVFNNSIEGFSIRIAKQEKNGNLKDILIYDHREMKGNNVVLFAKEGTMEQTADKSYLILTLKNGGSYKEVANSPGDLKTHPLIRDKFAEKTIRFDLSDFKLTRTKEDLFKMNYQMMNLSQLNTVIDSLQEKYKEHQKTFSEQMNEIYSSKTSLLLKKMDSLAITNNAGDSVSTFTVRKTANVIEAAKNLARSSKTYSENSYDDFKNDRHIISRYKAEWHRKFTLSIACIVLFFIGAPLGAIIRKGGLGMPIVVSMLFFIFFHILSITGEKLANEGNMPTYVGMWMATFILMPIGVFLTYKATADSSLFDAEAYTAPFKKLFGKRKEN